MLNTCREPVPPAGRPQPQELLPLTTRTRLPFLKVATPATPPAVPFTSVAVRSAKVAMREELAAA